MTTRTLQDIKNLLADDGIYHNKDVEIDDMQHTLIIRYGDIKFVFEQSDKPCKLYGKVYDEEAHFIISFHAWLVDDDHCVGEAIHDSIERIGIEYLDKETREENGFDF